MFVRYVAAGSLAALCACSPMSGIVGDPVPGDADVLGHVFQHSGQPLVGGTVVIDCGSGFQAATVPIDSTGQYVTNLVAPAPGRRRCAFGVPDLVTPRIRVDTTIGFAPNGQLHPLQFIDLREPAP
jgi:hypothetical protein